MYIIGWGRGIESQTGWITIQKAIGSNFHRNIIIAKSNSHTVPSGTNTHPFINCMLYEMTLEKVDIRLVLQGYGDIVFGTIQLRSIVIWAWRRHHKRTIAYIIFPASSITTGNNAELQTDTRMYHLCLLMVVGNSNSNLRVTLKLKQIALTYWQNTVSCVHVIQILYMKQ